MTKPIFITLRILIVALAFFTLKWLFLSSPTITLNASEIHCKPAGWDYLKEGYNTSGFFDIDNSEEMDQFTATNNIGEELAEQRRARDKAIEGCNLARDNRRLYMNLTAIFAVGAFIALPKPTRKKANFNFLKLKRKDGHDAVPESQGSTFRQSNDGEPEQQNNAG